MSLEGRIAVVGAGMVGASCAAELAGAVDLVVLDASIPAGGATAACMGHVVVMDDSEAQFALTRESRRLWDELAEQMPDAAARGVEREVCGTLWLAEDEEELGAARAKRDFYTQRGARAEMLDAEALRRAEPELRSDLLGALRIPDDSVVYPPAAVAWLLEVAAARCREAGRSFETRYAARVRSIEGAARDEGGSVRLELEGGDALEVDAVVLAAGLGSLEALSEPPAGLALRPRKGHLVITDRRPGFCRHQLVELGYLKSAHGDALSSVAFNLQPRATGQMLIGSSRQTDVRTRGVEPGILSTMLRRAAHFLPRLGELQAIRAWTGLRPATDDHLPYVGPLPGRPGVVLACGHEGLGITTAPGTARLVAHHVLGRPVGLELDPAAYSPARVGDGL